MVQKTPSAEPFEDAYDIKFGRCENLSEEGQNCFLNLVFFWENCVSPLIQDLK